jgi:hypothetical protein
MPICRCCIFLVNDQRDAQFLFNVFISVYNYLHVSSTQCASLGEANCINTASGNSHSMLVAEMFAGWKSLLSTDRSGPYRLFRRGVACPDGRLPQRQTRGLEVAADHETGETPT